MSKDALSKWIKFGGYIVTALFAGLLIPGFFTGETDLMSELYEKVGSIAEIGAIAAFALWLARILFLQLKKRKVGFLKWVQLAFKLLREHHTLIGWAAFSGALAHGSYFFLQTNEEWESIYSGLATLIGFAFLVTFGLILDKWAKGKKYLAYKKIHQAFAIVFGIALGAHLLFG
ncbi:hypothetical protein J7E38_07755 [Bacillus sp. ISL-35]|uniref:hypothetical protein n=1 Tax=Bacillus sp. ISL-35 TaxID=2819122 RepID=UPI001BE9E184|nr:hypothetical protein [Bacillus sp. ISL-35]MBT2678895.1 hypothetical protein [Bacillus sp. ISL-35]MBT2703891.1 hypothetical protein [Chryseobacterium sp. ISL-80]